MSKFDALLPFCYSADRPSPWLIDEPFSIDGYTYATDLAIAVRMKGELDRNPKLRDSLTFPRADQNDWWSQFPLKTTIEMPKEAFVHDRVKCEDCDGAGEHTCTCPDCDKLHKCESCEGEGDYDANPTISIGGHCFDAQSIRKIAALPGVKISIMPIETKAGAALLFESGEIQGGLKALIEFEKEHVGRPVILRN